MAKGKSKRRGSKYLGSLAAVVVGLLVLAGLAVLQDAGYLKTQVVTEEEKDYKVADLPVVDVSSAEVTGCQTPVPSAQSSQTTPQTTPRVLGISVGGEACMRGAGEGPLPRDYTARATRQKIKVPINGKDVAEIIGTACGIGSEYGKVLGEPCSNALAMGCAWPSTRQQGAGRFGVLYEKSESLARVLTNPYVYMMTKGYIVGFGYPIEGREGLLWAEGAYPAAWSSEDDLLWYNMGMKIWELSPGDVQKLREPSSGYYELVMNVMRTTELHEETHWDIFEWGQQKYLAALNTPPDDYEIRANSPDALVTFVRDKLNAELKNIYECEKKMHATFEEIERESLMEVDEGANPILQLCELVLNEEEVYKVPVVVGCNSPPASTNAP